MAVANTINCSTSGMVTSVADAWVIPSDRLGARLGRPATLKDAVANAFSWAEKDRFEHLLDADERSRLGFVPLEKVLAHLRVKAVKAKGHKPKVKVIPKPTSAKVLPATKATPAEVLAATPASADPALASAS